jgi:hypothetical protein
MIRRYMPVDNKNPKREWPCRAASHEIVMVKCGQITHTTEDLTSWVKSGLLCEFPPITVAAAQSIAPAAPAPTPAPFVPRTTSESIGNAFSDAMSGVFQKAAPSPVAAPAPAPVQVAPVAPVPVAPEVVEEAAEEAEKAVDAVADTTDYSTMKRAALWSLVVQRGLDSDREYRSLSKDDLVFILSGGTNVA